MTPSPHRIKSDCVAFPECGGCDYRHITYEEELFAKLQCVNNALKRIGGLSVRINEILHTGEIIRYRNKAVFHSNGVALGFYKAKSHDVIPVDQCLLLKEDINKSIKNLTQSVSKSGNDVTIRTGRNGTNPPHEEELGGLIFKLEGFFQVNTGAALLLFQKAREYTALKKSDTLIDLYCGVGALTLFVGRDAGHALGVEHNKAAVELARKNAICNNLSHIDFINAGVEKWETDITTPDCVIVDPPRKGLTKGAVDKIIELSPKRIVYVSCNPATMARDLKALINYTVTDICAIDMFPRTANIECCCLLLKK